MEDNYILGLDVSTTTIGIAIYKDLGDRGQLYVLKHLTPKLNPKPKTKTETLFQKCQLLENELMNGYSDLNITRVIIEEPLLRSNNVNTVSTLLKFNGMVSRSIYTKLNIVPDFISSYDARKYGFPELMAIRTHNKKGERYSQKVIDKKTENEEYTLFGALPWDINKKQIIWEKVNDLEPAIQWIYDRKLKLKKENYDMADAATCVLGFMNLAGIWPADKRKFDILK